MTISKQQALALVRDLTVFDLFTSKEKQAILNILRG